MSETVQFQDVARFPAPEDNAAIALRQLNAGTKIIHKGTEYELPFTVLRGHRFAVRAIEKGEYITSWDSPIGKAATTISRGDLIRTEPMLQALRSESSISDVLPRTHNMLNEVPAFVFDRSKFVPPKPLPRLENAPTFLGYRRPDDRGTGTRNNFILLGTTANSGGFVKQLESRAQDLLRAGAYSNVDSIVAIAHTEGSHKKIHDQERLLRTLAGIIINPNVGGVIAVDQAGDPVTNEMLLDWMRKHNYPINNIPNNFISLGNDGESFEYKLRHAEGVIRKLLPQVNATERTPSPASELRIALQCGGSDAFSGISGNPLAAAVAKRILQYGGSACLTETDELMSAEDYVLQNVASPELAERFLFMLKRFEENLKRFGKSGVSNPSGGNYLGGLLNIYLKSKGAATKKDPEVGIQHVMEYGELMRHAGYYFMDGPGNDLEGQSGQAAAGCNMVFFVTGNGAITNFPIMPTIKIMTNRDRFELVKRSMDVNAGLYLTGTPIDKLINETFDLTLRIASGERSIGEKAGIGPNFQIWRDMPTGNDAGIQHAMHESGEPIKVIPASQLPEFNFSGFRKPNGTIVSQQLGMIIPTSLCAGEVARSIAQKRTTESKGNQISRFVALPHTEGCGATNSAEHIHFILGHMLHPTVAGCFMVEHGCESVGNGRFRNILLGLGKDFPEIGAAMKSMGLNPDEFGWGSIQKDGGIDDVSEKIAKWFNKKQKTNLYEIAIGSWQNVQLGLISHGKLSADAANNLAALAQNIVTAGGAVIIPGNDALLQSESFTNIIGNARISCTLSYGQSFTKPGFHIMDAPSDQWAETITGLGATGVESIIAYSEKFLLTTHPFIPVINVTATGISKDFDLRISSPNSQQELQALLSETLSRRYTPKNRNAVLQISRGRDNVTL